VHRRSITPKTDVYNLGATMYWVLTRAFVPTALTGKTDSLVQGLDEAFIPKPKGVSELNPRVPEMLDTLVMQCVESNPDDRPSMDQVVERLNLIRGKLSAEAIMRKSGSSNAVGLRPEPASEGAGEA
jgi:serine/threonine-protein kinase